MAPSALASRPDSSSQRGLMASAVRLHLTERHEHMHLPEALEHDHLHWHDALHLHEHAGFREQPPRPTVPRHAPARPSGVDVAEPSGEM